MKKITLGIATVAMAIVMSLGVSAQTNQRSNARLLGNEPQRAELNDVQKALRPLPATMLQNPQRTINTAKSGRISTKSVSLTMNVTNVQENSADLELSFDSGVEVLYGYMPASTFRSWVAQYSYGDTIAEVIDDLTGDYAGGIATATTSGTYTFSGLDILTDYVAIAMAYTSSDTSAYWAFFTTTGVMPLTLSNITQNGSCIEFASTLASGYTDYYVYLLDSATFNQYYQYYSYGIITYQQLLQYSFAGEYLGSGNGNGSICDLALFSTYWVMGYAWNDTDTSNAFQLASFTTTATDGGTGDATVVATAAGSGNNWIAVDLTFNDQASYFHRGYIATEDWNDYVTNDNWNIDTLLNIVDGFGALSITEHDTLTGFDPGVEYLILYAAYNQNGERCTTLTTAPFAWDTVVRSTSGLLSVELSNLVLGNPVDSSATFTITGVNGCDSWTLYLLDTSYVEYVDRYWHDQAGYGMQDYIDAGYYTKASFMKAHGYLDYYGVIDNSMSATKNYDYSAGLHPGTIYMVIADALYKNGGFDILDSNMSIEVTSFATNWMTGGTGVPTLTMTTYYASHDGHQWGVNFAGNDEYAFCHFMLLSEAEFADYYNSDLAEVQNELLARTGYYNYSLSGSLIIDDSLAPQTRYIAFTVPYNKVWQAGAMDTLSILTSGLMPYVDVAITGKNCHDVQLTFTPNSVVEEFTAMFIDDDYYAMAERYLNQGYDLATITYYLAWHDSLPNNAYNAGNTPYTHTYEGTYGDGINYGQSFFIVIYASDGIYTNRYTYEGNDELNPYFHEECEGIEDAEQNAASIYPNPATNMVNIKADAIDHVEFYNALGQQVRSERVSGNEATLDLSGMARGIYMLKVYSGESYSTTKLVVE